MHQNSPNMYPPWTLKTSLSFVFKNGGMKFVPSSTNPYKQTIFGCHKNISKHKTMVYTHFSSHHTPIQIQPHQRKTIKHSQEYFEFTFTRIQIFVDQITKITCQNYHWHKSWQRIWPYCCRCIWHESSTWRTRNQSSRPCYFMLPCQRVTLPQFHLIALQKRRVFCWMVKQGKKTSQVNTSRNFKIWNKSTLLHFNYNEENLNTIHRDTYSPSRFRTQLNKSLKP